MGENEKDKRRIVSKPILLLLLTTNIFLFSSLILHWYTAQEIKNNFNDFSQQVKEESKNFSKVVSKTEEELKSIQKEIKGLARTIEELNAIEKELKNIGANLVELEKTGKELEETGENIKVSLDDLGELKEKIGGLVDTIKEFKKTVCLSCFNWSFKLNSYSSISNNIFEEREWKKLFKKGKLVISGKVETVKYSKRWLNRWDREVKQEEKDITIEKKEEIKEWKNKEEQKTDGEERKEFIFQEARCKDCERKLDLKSFSIKKLI